MNNDHKLREARPLRFIEINRIDGVWGWEAYTTSSGAGCSEDSNDIRLDAEDDPDDPPHESLTLGVCLEITNPIARGCKLVIHAEDGARIEYAWDGHPDDALGNHWKKVS